MILTKMAPQSIKKHLFIGTRIISTDIPGIPAGELYTVCPPNRNRYAEIKNEVEQNEMNRTTRNNSDNLCAFMVMEANQS
jgi:hypothetical protein